MSEQFSLSDLETSLPRQTRRNPAIGWLASLRQSFFDPLLLSRSIRSGINDLFNF
jgi:hypothetical protein